jgi:hypothetical protein
MWPQVDEMGLQDEDFHNLQMAKTMYGCPYLGSRTAK